MRVPVEDWPVGHSGNFREPGVGGCWAELPPVACGFPPAAVAPLLPPAPKPPPFPGSAASTAHFTQSIHQLIDTRQHARKTTEGGWESCCNHFGIFPLNCCLFLKLTVSLCLECLERKCLPYFLSLNTDVLAGKYYVLILPYHRHIIQHISCLMLTCFFFYLT